MFTVNFRSDNETLNDVNDTEIKGDESKFVAKKSHLFQKGMKRFNHINNTRQTLASKAGLAFPARRIHKKFKAKSDLKGIRLAASLYATAVLEYLTAGKYLINLRSVNTLNELFSLFVYFFSPTIVEVLELSGNVASEHKRKRITPRHILFAVRFDEELNNLLNSVTFPSAGVICNIHPKLLNKKN